MEKTNTLSLPPRDSIPEELHPVLTRKYTLVSPTMERVAAEVVAWIRNGVSGATIEGETRTGKSKTRRFVARVIEHNFPRTTIVSYLASRTDDRRRSDCGFFGSLLKAIKHPLWDKGNIAQRRDRLIERLVDLAQTSGVPKCVLLIDEAEYLSEVDFHHLAGIFNELDERSIELHTYQFGRAEISNVREAIRRNGQTQLLTRFFEDRIEFHGIRKLNEMKACLSRYDTHARFPENTGWTYARYYCPEAFSKGWRLADCAQQFWSAFEEVHRQAGQARPLEVPMKYLVRVAEQYLVRVGKTHASEPTLSQAELVQVVVSTRFGVVSRDELDREVENEEGDE